MEKPDPLLSTLSNECQEPPPEVGSSELAAVFGRPEFFPSREYLDWNADIRLLVKEKLAFVLTRLDEIVAQQNSLEKRFDELKPRQELLDQLSEQNRKFQERHHERHVMFPLLMALIRVADRCRDQIDNGQSCLRKLTLSQDHVLRTMISQFLAARQADLMEVEARLADFDILPYSCQADLFNPAEQKIVDKISHLDPQQNQKIACRHRPGYRRNNMIFRQEYVSVFIVNQNSHNKKGCKFHFT